MSNPLHERVDTPDQDDPERDSQQGEKALRRHLASLRQHLQVVESRIDEVEQLLEGDVSDSMADRNRKDVPVTVGAGRLLEAFSNGQRSAGQIYGLCAAVERQEDKHT